MDSDPRTPLGDIAALFLKLGTIAFGGPAAHVAMMEDEVVRRRRWLTHEQFLDHLSLTNLIPGPNSTELAILIGHARAGWPGLIVAGVCFILPAALIVTAIAWVYVRVGSLPAAIALLHGVKPVVIAIVLQALWRLGRAALKSKVLAMVAAIAALAAAIGVNELVVLAVAALVMLPLRFLAGRTLSVGLSPLFLILLKIGSVLFGSGYVLLAFLRADFVERFHWLTEQQLLDAIAVGQVTPGPVFTTATFIGYLLAGGSGAAVATIGIFAPAFVFVALTQPVLVRLRRSAAFGAMLDGVNVASLALMAVVTWQLGRSALVDVVSVVIAVVAFVLLVRFRFSSAWLVLGGAAAGLFMNALR